MDVLEAATGQSAQHFANHSGISEADPATFLRFLSSGSDLVLIDVGTKNPVGMRVEQSKSLGKLLLTDFLLGLFLPRLYSNFVTDFQ